MRDGSEAWKTLPEGSTNPTQRSCRGCDVDFDLSSGTPQALPSEPEDGTGAESALADPLAALAATLPHMSEGFVSEGEPVDEATAAHAAMELRDKLSLVADVQEVGSDVKPGTDARELPAGPVTLSIAGQKFVPAGCPNAGETEIPDACFLRDGPEAALVGCVMESEKRLRGTCAGCNAAFVMDASAGASGALSIGPPTRVTETVAEAAAVPLAARALSPYAPAVAALEPDEEKRMRHALYPATAALVEHCDLHPKRIEELARCSPSLELLMTLEDRGAIAGFRVMKLKENGGGLSLVTAGGCKYKLPADYLKLSTAKHRDLFGVVPGVAHLKHRNVTQIAREAAERRAKGMTFDQALKAARASEEASRKE